MEKKVENKKSGRKEGSRKRKIRGKWKEWRKNPSRKFRTEKEGKKGGRRKCVILRAYVCVY